MNITQIYSNIFTIARAIGGDSFEDLSTEELAELIYENALNDEEILEQLATEQIESEESSGDEEPVSFTANDINSQ